MTDTSDSAPGHKLRIGLTGGIASGKTTVSDMLARLGATVIDTDVIARRIVEPGQPALRDIVERFGESVLDADGALDRRALRRRIFADPADRRALESITHPGIRDACWQEAERATGAYIVFVVPLLVGSDFQQAVDRVLVVDCSPGLQLERLLARDGETMESAQRILSAQSDRSARLAIADDVIINDGDYAELGRRVARIHRHYLRLAGHTRPA
jgi:dephospho-CoA kinase